MGRVEPGRIDENQTVHGWLGHGDVKVLDNEKQLGRLGRWRGPGEIRGEIFPADPFADLFQWDRPTFLELQARHGEQFWSL